MYIRRIITICFGLMTILLTGCNVFVEQQQISPTLNSLETQVAQHQEIISYQATQIRRNWELVEYLATRGPASGYSQNLTITPTLTPFHPVSGSVFIHNGGCCMGGEAGETIEVDIQFAAFSVNGEVSEMRVLTGVTSVSEADMENALWEPFVSEKNYPVKLATNWTAFWVHVQYRDGAGVLSEIYSDEISLEGH